MRCFYLAIIAITVPIGFAIPCWAEQDFDPAGYRDAKILNNFAADLLNVQTSQVEATREYAFINPRQGWVFFSLKAPAESFGTMLLSLYPVPSDEQSMIHGEEKGDTFEAMRRLQTGAHRLIVRCEGAARPTALIIRAVPEIIFSGLGYRPWLRSSGVYNMEFLDRVGVLANSNVIKERSPIPDDAARRRAWRAQGKKIMSASYIDWLRRQGKPITSDSAYHFFSGLFRGSIEDYVSGFTKIDRDGTILSEFGGGFNTEEYSSIAEAIARIAKDTQFDSKGFYLYAGHLYQWDRTRPFVQAVIDAGYKLAENVYPVEQSTETAAREIFRQRFRGNMLKHLSLYPDYAQHMIMNLGYMSAPPESCDVNPGVDYKVFLDLQMNYIANEPAFFGLYGFAWYHSAYANEEIVRWSAKLNRHYCIEGKRSRLSDDPYILPHIENPDFAKGVTAWTIEPAEDGSISSQCASGYGLLQGRYHAKGAGDTVLVTRRNARTPNRVSQKIKKLVAGRTYSLTVFVTDYGEFSKGKSVKQKHHMNIDITGVTVVPEKGVREIISGGWSEGSATNMFDGDNQLYMTYQRIVFCPTSDTATLTISDWESDKKSSGPVGQELAFNFIQVQPYLED